MRDAERQHKCSEAEGLAIGCHTEGEDYLSVTTVIREAEIPKHGARIGHRRDDKIFVERSGRRSSGIACSMCSTETLI
jgi:hypothetical protein